jgi:hypothetical protein
VVSVLCCACVAFFAAGPAGASEILARNAAHVRLATDEHGRALVTYVERGRTWHVFVSGAINARQPSRSVRQVAFTKDYSGGRGEWRRFAGTCTPYDGPKLAWFVAGCKAADGSYWALQRWRRVLPNVGYRPWLPLQRADELHVSHWSGPTARLDASVLRTGGGRYDEVFGRATYRGRAIFGFHTTKAGNPLDTYGRLIYLDTFDSAYGRGWRRENSFVAHKGSGMYCYAFTPHSGYAGYPRPRSTTLVGNGRKYRLTLPGPGVTPDVRASLAGLPSDDATAVQTRTEPKLARLIAATGDRTCGLP